VLRLKTFGKHPAQLPQPISLALLVYDNHAGDTTSSASIITAIDSDGNGIHGESVDESVRLSLQPVS